MIPDSAAVANTGTVPAPVPELCCWLSTSPGRAGTRCFPAVSLSKCSVSCLECPAWGTVDSRELCHSVAPDETCGADSFGWTGRLSYAKALSLFGLWILGLCQSPRALWIDLCAVQQWWISLERRFLEEGLAALVGELQFPTVQLLC